MEFTCSCCGQVFDEIPDLGADEPVYWASLTAEEKALGFINSDYCVVNGSYFVRGILRLDITEYPEEYFAFGVWCSISEKSYSEIMRRDRDDAPLEGFGCFGWLNTNLNSYGFLFDDNSPLASNVEYKNNTQRPHFKLHSTDHPLYRAQRDGVAFEHIRDWVAIAHRPAKT